MKIKLLKEICCPEGSFQIGDIVDLIESTAIGLLDGGYAEAIVEDGDKVEPENNNTSSDRTLDVDGSKTAPKSRRK